MCNFPLCKYKRLSEHIYNNLINAQSQVIDDADVEYLVLS